MVNESPTAIVALNNNTILVGTTVDAGTGGEKKAEECSLFAIERKTRKLLWSVKPFSKCQTISDLMLLDDGTVLGVLDGITLFVFDSAKHTVLRQQTINAKCGTAVRVQGTRSLFQYGRDTMLVTSKGVAKLDLKTLAVKRFAIVPMGISNGGAVLNEHLYFSYASHLYSIDLNRSAIFETVK
jgi:hypothetical protein